MTYGQPLPTFHGSLLDPPPPLPTPAIPKSFIPGVENFYLYCTAIILLPIAIAMMLPQEEKANAFLKA